MAIFPVRNMSSGLRSGKPTYTAHKRAVSFLPKWKFMRWSAASVEVTYAISEPLPNSSGTNRCPVFQEVPFRRSTSPVKPSREGCGPLCLGHRGRGAAAPVPRPSPTTMHDRRAAALTRRRLAPSAPRRVTLRSRNKTSYTPRCAREPPKEHPLFTTQLPPGTASPVRRVLFFFRVRARHPHHFVASSNSFSIVSRNVDPPKDETTWRFQPPFPRIFR